MGITTAGVPSESKWRKLQDRWLYCGHLPQPAYCAEKVERQQHQEDSDLQSVGDCSIAAVLAHLGWRDFHHNFNVPAFFKHSRPKVDSQSFNLMPTG